MASTAQDRRSAILEEVTRSRVAHITDLTQKFGVSDVSIRRDLARLDRLGLLKRVHGGAVARPGVIQDAPNALKSPAHAAEKERIGHAAAAMIKEGDRLIFDSGTTVLQVARCIEGELLTSGNLTAITCSLPVVHELGPWKNVHMLMLGGIYLPEYQTVVGPQAIQNLNGLHADKMFLGTDGLTASHGVTTANVLEAELDRAMVRAASQVIVVADSSKIGVIGLTTIMSLKEINVLVTDKGAPKEFLAQLRESGVEVLIA